VDFVFEIGKGYAKHLPLIAAGTLAAWITLAALLWKAWEQRAATAAAAKDDAVTAFAVTFVLPGLVVALALLTVATVTNLHAAYVACDGETNAALWRLDGCGNLPGADEPRGGFLDPGR
jgi:hypothetical protein